MEAIYPAEVEVVTADDRTVEVANAVCEMVAMDTLVAVENVKSNIYTAD